MYEYALFNELNTSAAVVAFYSYWQSYCFSKGAALPLVHQTHHIRVLYVLFVLFFLSFFLSFSFLDNCNVNAFNGNILFFCIPLLYLNMFYPFLCLNSLLGLPKKFTTLERGPTQSRETPMPQWSRATGFTNRYRIRHRDEAVERLVRV